MRAILAIVLSAAVLAAITIGAAAQSMPAGSFRVAAAGSCNGWVATCNSRCKVLQNCGPDFCSTKLAQCRQSGCWVEGPTYGNKVNCGLVK